MEMELKMMGVIYIANGNQVIDVTLVYQNKTLILLLTSSVSIDATQFAEMEDVLSQNNVMMDP